MIRLCKHWMTLSVLNALLFTTVFANSEPELIQLTPPVIAANTIAQEIVCTRPMREGRFNISTELYEEKLDPKRVINCYGHGGSGWTTLFGSVEKAIELFEATQPDKEMPIRVIGSGCMGLTTAIELALRGYHVAGIYTKSLYDMPSWRAAGYLALVSVKTSAEEQANLDRIGMKTFLTYQRIEKGEHPYLSKQAVRYMPVYCSDKTDTGLEVLEANGLIPRRKAVTLDFGNGVIHPHYNQFMTYFMDTTSLMKQLTAQVKKLQIPIEMKEVSSFHEIEEDVIFNCAGLGAKALNGDEDLIAVRGHLIFLNEEAGTEHMNYMVYTQVEQDGQEEYVYLFPKSLSITPDNINGVPGRGTLGGTFIPNVEKLSLEEQEALDKQAFKRLLDRNNLFFHGRPYSE